MSEEEIALKNIEREIEDIKTEYRFLFDMINRMLIIYFDKLESRLKAIYWEVGKLKEKNG